MARTNFLMTLAAGFMLWLLSSAVPQDAMAQCCAPPPPPPPPCCAPPPPPCCQPPPAPPRPSPPPCCSPGHNVIIPGISVNVAATAIVNVSANAHAAAQASARGGAEGSGMVFMGGGGGGGGIMPPTATGIIQGLNVEGQLRKKRVAYEATRTRTRRIVIRAVCIDDRDVPHPASQVTPDRDIDAFYDGELYRCIAGSRLQITIAEFRGEVSFDGGETMVCNKNEALYHSPGAGGPQGGGRMECRPAKPARDCNERSLLRRFGAGVKVLTIVITERYTEYREETEESSSSSSSSASYNMSLDGGVGGVAY